MLINRTWAMASANTFTIKPVNALISRYMQGDWIDPFCRESVFKDKCKYTNDLNPSFAGTHNMDALEFMRLFPDNSFDGVLFDPPFSPQQAKEEYQGFGAHCPNTSRSFWTDRKNEAARILKIGGIAICCGWTSIGLGKKNGMEMIEVLLTCHGQQNDTITTVERKIA